MCMIVIVLYSFTGRLNSTEEHFIYVASAHTCPSPVSEAAVQNHLLHTVTHTHWHTER